ncbi:MAG: 16S rRNA (uracil(1498)-N(3))-methyltransferase [Elusimicrobiota bacterium]
MHRFFVENILGDSVVISGSEAHHLKNVLRKKTGDVVFLFDGKGNEYEAKIVAPDLSRGLRNGEIELELITKIKKDAEPKIKINLYQSIPRGKKFEFIIEKTTELGVAKIIPIISERTVPNVVAGLNPAKHIRWQKIALAAAKQCGRTIIPEISVITDFESAVKFVFLNSSESLSLILWECEQKTTLKQIIKICNLQSAICNLFVGPEGGFSNLEIKLARKNKVIPVSLGKRILRTETAPIVVIANILYELNEKK